MPLSAEEFLAAARAVYERTPGARLTKNQVGNLAIIDAGGEYVGYVDVGSTVGEHEIPGQGAVYLEDPPA